jgi:uncharacterized protein YbbC (DUF1343 family)
MAGRTDIEAALEALRLELVRFSTAFLSPQFEKHHSKLRDAGPAVRLSRTAE